MDRKNEKDIILVLSHKCSKEVILAGIKDANHRLNWNINSLCLIHSQSNNKWFNGTIHKIIFKQTNENVKSRWLIVKYNNKNVIKIMNDKSTKENE